MTKEITKAIILQELQDKFKLRDFDPAKFLFDETVVPVYDIGYHVKEHKSEYSEVSITSASAFLFFTVPDNERWSLSRYDVVFMGVGGYTVTGVYLWRKTNEYVYLDMKAGQSSSYHIDLAKEAVLNPGNTLKILVDSYTSTQNMRLYIDYVREEIR